MGDEQTNNTNPPGYNLFTNDEIVQVVYQSDPSGSLVGVETSLIDQQQQQQQPPPSSSRYPPSNDRSGDLENAPASSNEGHTIDPALAGPNIAQISRAASTLPSVAEESTSSGGGCLPGTGIEANSEENLEHQANAASYKGESRDDEFSPYSSTLDQGQSVAPISQVNGSHEGTLNLVTESVVSLYSTINKTPQQQQQQHQQQRQQLHQQTIAENQEYQVEDQNSALYSSPYEANQAALNQVSNTGEDLLGDESDLRAKQSQSPLVEEEHHQHQQQQQEQPLDDVDGNDENKFDLDDGLGPVLSRHKSGAVESGSFRHNFRKKLGLSVSTNENDLTAYRQKFLESQEPRGEASEIGTLDSSSNSLQKFKRTHSVSFNVNSHRSNRHSVDIRNLPSYLTHKRASIVDVAKGAMSSLISSLGGGGSGAGSTISSGHHRRDSSPDEEPIFEEPIAPTLSLGQRVALVRPSGAEFGTVGWIGQLPDVDDDWIVGVIFDNMIGNCDGAHNGCRYFYARENYAMFVPLSMLTKTDNYIGRPETGTMLSRMSVSLKPGQLISIQRSSIRLQHCFLNAPHQRVGHDVRAVSNRLHCQCHNCGPCAHLTKQGRITAIPHFGAHHLAHHKKNSLAHAAVEMLAHHHHHFHDEEEHEEEDYQFGDNAAHACNYVRYSCCQQNGVAGHEFLNDCEMVRPELLDNLIHAPKAPHRRSRPRRTRNRRAQLQYLQPNQQQPQLQPQQPLPALMDATSISKQDQHHYANTLDGATTTPLQLMNGGTLQSSSILGTETTGYTGEYGRRGTEGSGSSYSTHSSYSNSRSGSSSPTSSSSSSSSSSSPARSPGQRKPAEYNYYQSESSAYGPAGGSGNYFSTMDSQISIMDQRRFIFQRDSSAIIRTGFSSEPPTSDDQLSRTGGFGSSIMKCFRCFRKRSTSDRYPRSRPKRKLSAKDRMMEYRRKQSTFVPSTLAKPQEDFASHGIMFPSTLSSNPNNLLTNGAHSDYSSFSKSSCSSRSNSPDPYQGANERINFTQTQDPGQTTASGVIEQQSGYADQQLKSTRTMTNHLGEDPCEKPQLDYGDYSFNDGYDSYNGGKIKNESSRDSALTELGYSDATKTLSSCDTLKQLVDHSINEQVNLPQMGDYVTSPISTALDDDGATNSEQVEVSSPTASLMEQDELSLGLENLQLDRDVHGHNGRSSP